MVEGRDRAPGGRRDESLVRRTKALARTAPIHGLEESKGKREGDWSPYDLRALSLAAIDAVIDHMGLEHGATPDAVLDRLESLARLAAPDRPRSEGRRVATAVLESLLNDRGRREAFSLEYGDWTAAEFRRRRLTFKLREEVEAPDGAIVRRAEDLEVGESIAVRVAEAELDAVVEAVRTLADV